MRYRGWIPWLLLLGQLGIVNGQSALDGFDPQATSAVDTIALQQDGKILLGGSFTSILGGVRNGIARLNFDGTLDNTFNPNPAAHSFINLIALQADGKILVSGSFGDSGTIGGQTRGYMARLDPATGTADSFNPSPDQPPFAVVVQPDGKILIGGQFTDRLVCNKRAILSRGSIQLLAWPIPSMRTLARAGAGTLTPSPCSQMARCLSADLSPRWQVSHATALSGLIQMELWTCRLIRTYQL